MRVIQYGPVCLALGLIVPSLALASNSHHGGTPDHTPPAKEHVCDGLQDAAFGLCNAFCEAQDCDVSPKHSCDELRRNWQRQTGLSTFPCENGVTPSATA